MRTFSLFIFSLVLGLGLFSSFALPASPPSNQDQEAVLHHLTELRQELKALRQEMGQLRQAVSEIHRSAVTPPSALKGPPSVPVGVALGDGPSLGKAEAQVAVVEFTDFECPFCQRFHSQTFSQIKETYIDSGKIRYLVRNYPLGFHAQAKPAAVAANCAGKQGQYWEMQHALFTNQRCLGADLYSELAATLKLNEEVFHACLEDPSQAQTVDTDQQYGQSIGVRGTPNFFIGRIQDGKMINATHISGAQPFTTFSRALDSLLP